jgi:hypothetical protein
MSFEFMASQSMMWLPMKLIQSRFSSGLRVQAETLPILVPFIYEQLKLRHLAYDTAAAHLRAIPARSSTLNQPG